MKEHKKRQVFIGMITQSLDKLLMNEFYLILRKITDISEEEVKDEAHAIELYKQLRNLEI